MSTIFYKDNPYGGTTTVTDAGHVLVTQGSDTVTAQAKFNTQTTAIQRILGNFATVEESTTASKAYNLGDYLVLNSFLYKVTYPIAAGGTIDNTQNGNVVKTNAGEEFKNANNSENSVYDNTESGLTATNVQDALDELEDEKVEEKTVEVTAVNGTLGDVSVIQEGKLVSGYISISYLTATAYSWLNLCRINVHPNVQVFAHAFLNTDGSDCAIIRFNADQDMVHIYPTKAIDNTSINFMFTYRTA